LPTEQFYTTLFFYNTVVLGEKHLSQDVEEWIRIHKEVSREFGRPEFLRPDQLSRLRDEIMAVVNLSCQALEDQIKRAAGGEGIASPLSEAAQQNTVRGRVLNVVNTRLEVLEAEGEAARADEDHPAAVEGAAAIREPAAETRTLVRPQPCEQHDTVPGSQATTTRIPAQEATGQMAVASQDQAATESVNRGGRPKGTHVDGKKLREFRELADLTQEGLAKECEVSLSTIQRGEAGERWDEDTITKVAGVLSTRTGKNNPVSPKDLKNLKN
jgi:DNA-binding XRE family transcriptional regulator